MAHRAARTTCCFKAQSVEWRRVTISCTSASGHTTRASIQRSYSPARSCGSSSAKTRSAVATNRAPPMASDADLAVLCQARRILVLGSPGAGKTLLATSLCRHLGLQLVRLDDFFWKPGPVRLPTDEWRTRVAQLAARPSWVMDGTYEAS